MSMDFDYIVADPTGNITVLITSPYTEATRQDMIQESFIREPSCEQVGFIMPVSDDVVKIEMMGFEFCGNATLSTAAWHAGMHGLKPGAEAVVTVDSSGTDSLLDVRVRRHASSAADEEDADSIFSEAGFEGTVSMPVPSVTSFTGYPLVQFNGISHLIVPAHDFSDEQAENAAREYAAELGVPALGLMLCPEYDALISGSSGDSISIRPLVFVPASQTLFWEHGCATGSTAAGWYRYSCDSRFVHTEIKQPGGTIIVDVAGGQPMLTGNVVFRPGK